MNRRRLLRGASAALLALSFFGAGSAAAHPYSTSRGEIDWNAESGSFEVALAVLPEELVQMVGAERGEPFFLDASAECDRAIAGYLSRHFALQTADGETARLDWVGKEISFEATWLYFELKLAKPPRDLSGLKLRVDLGFELSHEHINAVRIRLGEKQQGLLFSRLAPSISL